jgi:hypothetical protein
MVFRKDDSVYPPYGQAGQTHRRADDQTLDIGEGGPQGILSLEILLVAADDKDTDAEQQQNDHHEDPYLDLGKFFRFHPSLLVCIIRRSFWR